MFKNKHVIVALLVSPILAVLTWFAVGSLSGEQAQPAQPGQTYPLVENSNCRYASGQCDLDNEDLRLSLSFEPSVARPALVLTASHPLENVLVAVADPGEDGNPLAMRARTHAMNEWTLTLDSIPGRDQRIRLVAAAAGSQYYADAATTFLEDHRE